jgi:hypothetical protein
MIFEPHLESQEEAEVAPSVVRRIWWLSDGWNLFLQQKLLHDKGDVSGGIAMVQDPIVCPLPTLEH